MLNDLTETEILFALNALHRQWDTQSEPPLDLAKAEGLPVRECPLWVKSGPFSFMPKMSAIGGKADIKIAL